MHSLLGEFNTRLERFFSSSVQVVGLIGQVVDQTFPASPVKKCAHANTASAN